MLDLLRTEIEFADHAPGAATIQASAAPARVVAILDDSDYGGFRS